MTPTVKRLRPLQDFLKTEAASGLLLLAMVPIALLWANGPLSESYDNLWSTKMSIGFGSSQFTLDLRHWVNDGLMGLFFFVVGLEIKREFLDGELRDRRKALTPVLAAIGGMALPALIYVAINARGSGAGGWGIPMATDIAIVLGFLALLGDRVPSSLKTFLLTLAIVDDIGAILVIALFYSEHSLNIAAFGIAIGLFFSIYVLNRLGVRQPVLFVAIAIAAWVATYKSGIHATLVGVVLAFLTPGRPIRNPEYVDVEVLGDVSNYEAASETATLARETVSSVEWLQHVFHPWSSYVVLPIFALANAGIQITGYSLAESTSSLIALGVVAGLLFGKPLGICAATWLSVRVLGGNLPTGVQPRAIMAGSVLAAVGFTVSLFISDLAFSDEKLISEAKAGVLAASVIAGGVGLVALRLMLPKAGSK